jgi:hypothetical protein
MESCVYHRETSFYYNNELSLEDHHSWRDVHSHEFLEEELCCVGKFDLRNLRLVLAPLALERIVAKVGDGDQTANENLSFFIIVWRKENSYFYFLDIYNKPKPHLILL